MGSAFLDLLLKMALSVGVPAATNWLFNKWPWLRKIFPKMADILSELIEGLKEAAEDKKDAKQYASHRIKKECLGVACAPTLKKS